LVFIELPRRPRQRAIAASLLREQSIDLGDLALGGAATTGRSLTLLLAGDRQWPLQSVMGNGTGVPELMNI